MTDAPAYDLRQEIRESIILDFQQVEDLGKRLGFNRRDITTVQTVCFWLRHELPADQVSLEDLLIVFDNPILRQWLYALHPEARMRRFEQVCNDFVIQCSLIVDQMIATDPNPEVHA